MTTRLMGVRLPIRLIRRLKTFAANHDSSVQAVVHAMLEAALSKKGTRHASR